MALTELDKKGIGFTKLTYRIKRGDFARHVAEGRKRRSFSFLNTKEGKNLAVKKLESKLRSNMSKSRKNA